MRKGALILPLLVCSAAFAQLDSNSITVTASNNVSLQPDQAIFEISVQSSMTTGLDDVLAALQGSGVTVANLWNVNALSQICLNFACSPSPQSLNWTFRLPVALDSTKATVAALTTLQGNVVKANNGLTVSFGLFGTQVSQQLAQSQTCSLSALIANATTQAQALAAAGGVTLGSILALSSVTANVPLSLQFGSSPLPCTVTVKFNVLHY